MRKLAIFGALGLALGASPVLADTIVQTIPFESGVLDGGMADGGPLTDGNGTFGGDFQKFNPSDGTLDQVMIAFNGTMTYASTVTAYGRSPTCADGSCQEGAPVMTAGFAFDAPGFPYHCACIWAQQFARTGWEPGVGDPDIQPISYAATTVNTAGYVGVNDVWAGGAEVENDACGDGGAMLCTEDLNLATTLIYTYTPTIDPPTDPVPEPTSLWLLGTGLGLFGLVGWRRHGRLQAA